MRLKTSYTIIFILFGSFGCSEENNPQSEINTIVGAWQQIQNAYSPGAGIIIDDLEDGPILTLSENGSFTLIGLTEQVGEWEVIGDNEFMLDFNGNQMDISYEYSFSGNIMKLIPSNPRCVETCFSKWENVN